MMDQGPAAVRSAVEADVPAIAEIHRESLAGDVFPSMGTHFLRKYYRHLLQSDFDHLYVAMSGGKVAGFIAVSMETQSVLRLVSVRDLLHLAFSCVRKPGLLLSSIVQLRKRGGAAQSDSAEISFFAVGNASRGQGIGRMLLAQAMTLSRDKGKVYTRTKTSNRRLSRFYQDSFGAAPVERFTVLGREFVVLKWKV
jgi:ribosomal protein S18 acetylase RimI-like enzyme